MQIKILLLIKTDEKIVFFDQSSHILVQLHTVLGNVTEAKFHVQSIKFCLLHIYSLINIEDL